MLDKLTLDDFRERLGETFVVTPRDAQGAPVERDAFRAELRRAEPSPYSDHKRTEGEAAPDVRVREPFSIEFHARTPHHVPQQMFVVAHESMGTFDLFLVPLGPDAEGQRYEAVFG